MASCDSAAKGPDHFIGTGEQLVLVSGDAGLNIVARALQFEPETDTSRAN